jgi:hypothetical protein
MINGEYVAGEVRHLALYEMHRNRIKYKNYKKKLCFCFQVCLDILYRASYDALIVLSADLWSLNMSVLVLTHLSYQYPAQFGTRVAQSV